MKGRACLKRRTLPGSHFPPDGRRLYAVNELDDYEGTKGGAVSAYAVEMDGSLHFLNRLPVMGAAPCHVDCAPEEGSPKYVYTAITTEEA